mmetsp:Transcript_20664/g.43629  ORF Transcript_20664/g.43629 Transcript_20664/m.43629 type:complete len:207 (+) Transcript_20664:407-1027(+)
MARSTARTSGAAGRGRGSCVGASSRTTERCPRRSCTAATCRRRRRPNRTTVTMSRRVQWLCQPRRIASASESTSRRRSRRRKRSTRRRRSRKGRRSRKRRSATRATRRRSGGGGGATPTETAPALTKRAHALSVSITPSAFPPRSRTLRSVPPFRAALHFATCTFLGSRAAHFPVHLLFQRRDNTGRTLHAQSPWRTTVREMQSML